MDSDLLSPVVIPFRRPAAAADWRAAMAVGAVPRAGDVTAAAVLRPLAPERDLVFRGSLGGASGGALADALTLAMLLLAAIVNAWLLLAAFGVRLF